MKRTTIALIAAGFGAGALLLGGAVAVGVVVFGAKRQPVLFRCSADNRVEYVMASGPEYLIVNPSQTWGRNSFLVSNEAGAIPRNWRFLGMSIRSANADGFTLAATESRPYMQSVTFETKARSLALQYGGGDKRREVLSCSPSTDLPRVQAAANNVPVEYLLARKSSIPFLNPGLGQRQFNLSLYDAVRSKQHATYAIYQLLSAIPAAQLSGDQNMIMAEARKELIKANSSQINIWEFGGTYRYRWQFANEQTEANTNAGNWCRQQSGTLSEYTAKGYQISSQTSEERSSGGWVRQEYPDGRFSGYVNYEAWCDGTNYALTKAGSVDNENENSLDYYD